MIKEELRNKEWLPPSTISAPLRATSSDAIELLQSTKPIMVDLRYLAWYVQFVI